VTTNFPNFQILMFALLRKFFPKPEALQAYSSTMSDVTKKDGRSTPSDKDRLVWVDCEMTGLDIDTCHLIEMACIVTDGNLQTIAEGPNIIIHQSDEILNSMNEWCIEQHGQSGLTQAVRDSKISLQQAEMEMLSFIRQHVPEGKCPLAGNSIHADKKFLDKYMPQFINHLHYRIIDVSTIKELCRRWNPQEFENAPKKANTHRALDDINESIKELMYYRRTIFKQNPGEQSNM
ncbi:unnamed protein product, partial [Owenia fusiformis]